MPHTTINNTATTSKIVAIDSLNTPLNPSPKQDSTSSNSSIVQIQYRSANALQTVDLSCRVIAVKDGDTIDCLDQNKQSITVRLDQIDSPEKKQDFGNAAKQQLSKFVFGKMVNLKITDTDKYGRTIAEIFVDDSNINKAMVQTGYAWVYQEYSRDVEYLTLEQQAKSQKLGLWSQPNPIYPSHFRQQKHSQQHRITAEKSTRAEITNDPSLSRFSCSNKRYCKEMNSCSEARYYLTQCGISKLDGDHDGIPCESLCG